MLERHCSEGFKRQAVQKLITTGSQPTAELAREPRSKAKGRPAAAGRKENVAVLVSISGALVVRVLLPNKLPKWQFYAIKNLNYLLFARITYIIKKRGKIDREKLT